ncbi:hypothetical protein GCM10025880_40900 [Methylorubrum aminovorans]|nr:hypothetical protein GCM10025880_40900 [Methylorubrum aminovorans]
MSQPPEWAASEREDAPKQHHDLADRQFGDAAGVREGRVEDRDAAGAGRVEIDLIGADAEAADRDEGRGGVEQARRHLRARTNAEDVGARQRLGIR